jgi:chromosome segregation ATPase
MYGLPPLCLESGRRRALRTSGLTAVMILMTLQSATLFAADDKKEQNAARRYEALLQRYEQERTQWQAERSELQKKIAANDQALAAEKAAADKTSQDLEQSTKARSGLQKTISDLNRRIEEQQRTSAAALAAKGAEIEAFNKARLMERTTLNAHLASEKQELATCLNQNERLLALGHDLLQRYRDKGFEEILKQEEPFLGFGDTQMFNLVQEYRGSIDAQRALPDANAK